VAHAHPKARRFRGFPDGRLRATVLPSIFFGELLGQIDDPGELKVVLYLFWRLGQVKRYPRFFTRRELEHDATIQRGLANLGPGALGRSLDRAVERGVVLRRTIELRGVRDECYFLNTASGRRSIRDLEEGKVDLGHVVLPEEPDRREARPNVFELYEQNVGLLTPLIVDALSEAERRYPGEWIEDAFREAVAYNRRSWKYVERILERWATEGRRDEAPGRGARDAIVPPRDRPR
jgi:DnaD/phage-associated family protein